MGNATTGCRQPSYNLPSYSPPHLSKAILRVLLVQLHHQAITGDLGGGGGGAGG